MAVKTTDQLPPLKQEKQSELDNEKLNEIAEKVRKILEEEGRTPESDENNCSSGNCHYR